MNLYQFTPPDELYRELFDAVQRAEIFQDSKTFVDCIPVRPAADILKDYNQRSGQEGFDLKGFILDNFKLPEVPEAPQISHSGSLEVDLNARWQILTRAPDIAVQDSSLLPLPSPYIVPGGRFREIYYWDSYFTMLGLRVSGEEDMIASMVENFAHLINTVGHVPNGNRTYYLSRSQPPFFAKMVEVLSEVRKDKQILQMYYPEMMAEYQFWMDGAATLHLPGKRCKRLLRLDEGAFLNRYFDEADTPRAESFREDVKLSERSGGDPERLYRNLRAACESGWDFSSRWLSDPKDLCSVETLDLVPVDLNAILSETERILAETSEWLGHREVAAQIWQNRKHRIEGLNRYCWDSDRGIFLDYHTKSRTRPDRPSLAMLYPLWAGIADDAQAQSVIDYTVQHFLQPGGLTTTEVYSGQQWDAPNGWAPLQWIGFEALTRYGREDLALELAERWTQLNEKVHARTGKMMEKYNVKDLSLHAGGGEYPVQDGFGWTNGVYLAMKERLGRVDKI